jgi:hypothetical protein
VKGGELHSVEVKLWEGLSWIGRSCGGLPTVSREVTGEELERRRCTEARGELRAQGRANWRERELLKVLDQPRRVGEARTGASHYGGEVAAGQSSGRDGATWSAWEKARGEKLGRRPALGRRVGAARAGGGAGTVAAAVSSGDMQRQVAASGSAAVWSLGESQQEGVEAVGEHGGDAWWPGEAGEASGGVARRPAAALLRGRGGAKEQERGGRQGLICSFKNSRDLGVKSSFLTVLYLK